MSPKKQSKRTPTKKKTPTPTQDNTQTPTQNIQDMDSWVQSQQDKPIYSAPGFGFPSPQQGYHQPPQGYPQPPQGYHQPPQGYPQPYPYPPPQGYPYPPPQGSFTSLLTQGDYNTSPPLANSQTSSFPSSQSQSQSQPQTHTQTQTQVQPDIEVEEIDPVRAKKGKGKAKAMNWTTEECEVLAKCWIHISEDAIVSNDQRRSDFWNRITAEFLNRMGKGPYRTKDQVYSKYSKMNKDVMYFNDIYLNITRTYPSGWDETKVIEKVSKFFQGEQLKPFAYLSVWMIVRDNAKWRGDKNNEEDPSSGSHKRPRTSESEFSDATAPIDVNEVPQPPPAQRARPMGRDRAKAQARAQAKGPAREVPEALLQDISGLNQRLGRLLDSEAEKQEERDMAFLMTDTSDWTGERLAVANYRKDKIRKKYGLNF